MSNLKVTATARVNDGDPFVIASEITPATGGTVTIRIAPESGTVVLNAGDTLTLTYTVTGET